MRSHFDWIRKLNAAQFHTNYTHKWVPSILYLAFCRPIKINEEKNFNESWIVFFSCYVEFVIVILDAVLFHDNITFSKKGKHVLVAFFLYFLHDSQQRFSRW